MPVSSLHSTRSILRRPSYFSTERSQMLSVPPERALDGSALDFGIPTGHATRDVVSHWPEAVSRYRTRQLTNWVFRSIVPSDSGLSCPPIPVHRAHSFRSIVPSLRACVAADAILTLGQFSVGANTRERQREMPFRRQGQELSIFDAFLYVPGRPPSRCT